jgi:hypothetical protein
MRRRIPIVTLFAVLVPAAGASVATGYAVTVSLARR